jgi:PAS domain S-box-containing protein
MKRERSSARTDIMIFISVVMVFTTMVVGFIVFSSWKASTEEMIGSHEKDVHQDIVSEMEGYLDSPLRINLTNHYSIRNEIVDIDNIQEREIFFAGIVKSMDSNVYSFSYGTETGEYHGARRNLQGEIEIIRVDESTSGNFAYFEINDDLTAGKMLGQVGEYDPRTREWYRIAKDKGEPAFSPTYTNFLLKDLAITAAYPVYDEEGTLKGVLGTHFIVSAINGFLEKVVSSNDAAVFIFERRTGEVIASTQDLPRFMSFPDKPIERVTIEQLDNDLFSQAYQEYQVSAKKDFVVDAQEDTYGVKIVEYQRAGLDWIVITAIPRGQFFTPIIRGFWMTFGSFILAMLVMLAILISRVNSFFRPIRHLSDVAEAFIGGDFGQRVKVKRNDEVGRLGLAFNGMADRFHADMNLSEEKLVTKTAEMQKSNTELEAAAERIRNAFNSMGRGFITTDRFGDVAMMNTEAETLTGWTQEDAVGVPCEEVFNVLNAATGEKCHSLIVRVFEKGEQVEFHCEPVLTSRDGVRTPIEGIASPIEDVEGRRTGVVILFAKSRSENKGERLRSIPS